MSTIDRHGDGYVLTARQFFDRPREEVFPFFADASNLSRITPKWIDFAILTPTPIKMRQGTVIDYRIRLFGVPMQWRTDIAVWEPPVRFVDTQLRGPYRYWIHEHTFEDHDGDTLMHDRVEFCSRGLRAIVPLVHRLFVNGNVSRIFAYRNEALEKLLTRRANREPEAIG
jgi:ligand-binding SRPBCC domain-containing protein